MDLCHFCVLIILLLAQEGLTVVVVEISQPNGRRVIDLAEVQLFQDGLQLPEYLAKFSFSSPALWHHDAEFCNDGNLLTSCHNSLKFNESSGVWEGEEANPSLYIMLDEAFFDELVVIPLCGQEFQVVGAKLSVFDNEKPVQVVNSIFDTPQSNYTVNMKPFLANDRHSVLKITDSFPYNGDLIALTRVKYLFEVVDEFIIVESWTTFSGVAKTHLYFLDPDTYSMFRPYMHKIKYVVIKYFPEVPSTFEGPLFAYSGTLDNWWREHYMRSFFKFYVRPYHEDTTTLSDSPLEVFIISDCDEIPDREVLWKLRNEDSTNVLKSNPNDPKHFTMNLFYYNMNWLSAMHWYPAYMISAKGLFEIPDASYPRYVYEPDEHIGFGWHCSYFMPIADIVRKLESFSHQELNTDENKNVEHIKNCLTFGLDLYNRSSKAFGLTKINDEQLRDNIPAELYDFHLKVLALQQLD